MPITVRDGVVTLKDSQDWGQADFSKTSASLSLTNTFLNERIFVQIHLAVDSTFKNMCPDFGMFDKISLILFPSFM